MSQSHGANSAPLSDPSALAQFGKLEVVARLVVEGYMTGMHKSPFKGASVEFVEHRQYYPGDEIRHIDWRAFGKTGKYYIKEFEDETNLRCHLIVDASGSMGYGGQTISKFEYARLLAASLGYLLITQRDAVGLTTFDTAVRDRLEPSTSRSAFANLTQTLEQCEPGGETALSEVFGELIPGLRRRSLVVILSDCFDEMDNLVDVLKRFRHARHEVVLFQIVTPEEETFPFSRPTQFHNRERRSHRLLVDPHRLREIYLEQYNSFCRDLETHCGAIGVDYQKVVTSDPYQKVLGSYLDMRTRRRKKR